MLLKCHLEYFIYEIRPIAPHNSVTKVQMTAK